MKLEFSYISRFKFGIIKTSNDPQNTDAETLGGDVTREEYP